MPQQEQQNKDERFAKVYFKAGVQSDGKAAQHLKTKKENFRNWRQGLDLPPCSKSHKAEYDGPEHLLEHIRSDDEEEEGTEEQVETERPANGSTGFVHLKGDGTYEELEADSEEEAVMQLVSLDEIKERFDLRLARAE